MEPGPRRLGLSPDIFPCLYWVVGSENGPMSLTKPGFSYLSTSVLARKGFRARPKL